MRKRRGGRLLNRRSAVATMAGGASLFAAPTIIRAQTPLTVSFGQQRGSMKSDAGDWKQLFWDTAYGQQGD